MADFSSEDFVHLERNKSASYKLSVGTLNDHGWQSAQIVRLVYLMKQIGLANWPRLLYLMKQIGPGYFK
ncbi:hypothetical protein SUGI_1000070 [Cryptomeria japonica]|nr:hypothetical protein SUGI_1000070 [Cryptomeria japonica]